MIKTPTLQQQAITNWFENGKGNLIVEARAGSGKCLGTSTPVMMADGTIKMVEDIKPFDLLMGPDSKPRTVLSTTRGNGPLYRIVPIKGDPWICNDVHVLTLKGTNWKTGQIIDIPLNELIEESKGKSRLDKNWKLFRVPVEFPTVTDLPPISSYMLGLWLGDGTVGEPTISTVDPEIVAYCKRYAEEYGYDCNVREDRTCISVRISSKTGLKGSHPMRSYLRAEFPEGKTHIPVEYLRTCRQTRLNLLAGLIDSDGHNSGGCCDLIAKHESFANDILYLCRSLGFAAYMVPKECRINSTGFSGTYYRISISGDLSIIPTKVPHKTFAPRQQVKDVLVTGFEVESIGDGYYYGFTLDGDGRFLLGDFTVTHNTSTVIHGIAYAKESKILLVAYNKHIATELQRRLDNPNATAKTIHSVGFGILRKEWPWASVNADIGEQVVRKVIGGDAHNSLVKLLNKIYTQTREVCPFAVNDAHVEAVMDQFDLYPDDYLEEEGFDTSWLTGKTLEIMSAAQEKRAEIDFADMVWLPLIRGWIKPTYGLVVIDELQDINTSQLETALRLAKGRIVGVGDSRQCIYSFRGADMAMMDNMRLRLKAQILPMTITQRCPKTVVEAAKKLVPDLEASERAKDGAVRVITAKKLSEYVKPKDAVLSRTNAILSKAAFQLMREGISVQILGKDIGAHLIKQIRSFKCLTLPDLCAKVVKWSSAEQEKALAANRKNRAEIVRDQAETILFLSEECQSIPELIASIEALFNDKIDPVICATVHKAKGLEWDTVFILEESFLWTRNRAKNDADAAKEEANIEYVAITRAKETLFWVHGRPGTEKAKPKVTITDERF